MNGNLSAVSFNVKQSFLLMDGAQRYHQSQIRNPKSKISALSPILYELSAMNYELLSHFVSPELVEGPIPTSQFECPPPLSL